MTKRLPRLVLVSLFLAPAGAFAQTGNQLATTAPATLGCGVNATAGVNLQFPPRGPFELMLVLDGSGSLSLTEFNHERTFALSIVDALLEISPTATRVGVTMYGQNSAIPQVVLSLSGSESSIRNTLLGVSPPAGGTSCPACAIQTADQSLQATARPGVPRYMIVVTDSSNFVPTGQTIASIAQVAKQRPTTLIAVGILDGGIPMSDLQAIASSPQTLFTASTASQLPSLVAPITSLWPAPGSQPTRTVNLAVASAFTAISVTATDGTAILNGNTIEWTMPSSATSPADLSLQFTRSSFEEGSSPLFSSVTYADSEGGTATVTNASINLPFCEVQSLQHQIATLQAQIAGLNDHIGDLLEQIEALEIENENLRRELAGGSAPTGTGSMRGGGQVAVGRIRHIFELAAAKYSDGNLKLSLTFKVCELLPEQADTDLGCGVGLHRLVVSYFTAVQFTDDPDVTRSDDPANIGVDTMLLSGVGRWNDADGYRFTVRAVDSGDALGPNTDVFSLEITGPDGTIVTSVVGTLAWGNLEAQ
jgi:hypothetical protein